MSTDAARDKRISFRPLLRSDFSDIIRWHRAPHAAKWFADSPLDSAAAEREYGPCIDGLEPTKLHIVEIDRRSIGYLQHYLVRDYPDYLEVVREPDAGGIDFIIGEPAYVGRGLGPRIISEYITSVVVPSHPGIRKVVSSPDPGNGRSIRALEKIGFDQVRTIVVDGKLERLCLLNL